MKVSSRQIVVSLLVLGGFCTVFGLYFFEVYSPLRNPTNDPDVILWYPIGLALMFAGVSFVVAAGLEARVDRLHKKMGDMAVKVDRLIQKADRYTGGVDDAYLKDKERRAS